MNWRQVLMIVALAGSAGLAIFGDKTPEGEGAELAERSPAGQSRKNDHRVDADKAAARGAASTKVEDGTVILSLREREPVAVGPAASAGLSLFFGSQNWDPPPPKAVPAPPPPPPTAPPLPYTYMGKKFEGGVWEVYLSRGEDIQVVRPNTVIDNTYRVGAITPPSLALTYLPLNQLQQLSIGATD